MNKRSKVKDMVIISLLCAIGLVSHQIMPAFFGMQADFTLIMLGIIVITYKDSFDLCVTSGAILGIFTALTTKFPAGQIPNILDKMLTSIIMYFLFNYVINKINKKIIKNIIVFVAVTLISGIIFLGSAYLLVGLPGPFMLLFATSVLPAIVINTIVGIIIEPIVEKINKKIYY